MSSSSNSRSVLLIDIASSSVGVGLSGIREKELPELVFTARVPFANRTDFDFKLFEPAMMVALKDVLQAAFRGGVPVLVHRGYPTHLDHAIISFSSPWFVSEVGAEEGEFVRRLSDEYGEEMKVFERDGALLSATQKKILRRIEDEIIRTFGIERGIGAASFSVVFSKVLGRAFPDLGPSLYADMTGHATDFLAKQGRVPHGSITLPQGHLHVRDPEHQWYRFWREVSLGLPSETLIGNVFIISDDSQAERLERLLAPSLPKARLIPFNRSSDYLREFAAVHPGAVPNERLIFLAAYSNLFL